MKKQLLIDYFEGKLSPKKSRRVEEWILKKPENQHYYSEIKNLWVISGLSAESLREEEIRSGIEDILKGIDLERSRKLSFRTLIKYTGRVAAVLFIPLLIAAMYMYYNQYMDREPLRYSELNVPNGEKSSITLSDGTQVWLNSNTSLRFSDFSQSDKREVFLEGEAFFDVTKDDKKIFIVHTNDIQIKVFGTKFNVMAYPEDNRTQTTLVSGLVSVQGNSFEFGGKEKIYLQPKQTLTITRFGEEINTAITALSQKDEGAEVGEDKDLRINNRVNVQVKQDPDTDQYTAWKDLTLVFRDETFAEVAKKMERWYDVKIHFEDEDVKEYKYWGSFDNETIEQAIKALHLTTPFNYTLSKRDIYITKK